jgi:hypothetical protein
VGLQNYSLVSDNPDHASVCRRAGHRRPHRFQRSRPSLVMMPRFRNSSMTFVAISSTTSPSLLVSSESARRSPHFVLAVSRADFSFRCLYEGSVQNLQSGFTMPRLICQRAWIEKPEPPLPFVLPIIDTLSDAAILRRCSRVITLEPPTPIMPARTARGNSTEVTRSSRRDRQCAASASIATGWP